MTDGIKDGGAAKIVTERVFPPIPLRQFDWCAWFDGEEEHGPQGWGRTEHDAIADLETQAEEVQ